MLSKTAMLALASMAVMAAPAQSVADELQAAEDE